MRVLLLLDYCWRYIDGSDARGGRMGPTIQVGQAICVFVGMRPV